MRHCARSVGLALAVLGFTSLWPPLAAAQRSEIPFSHDNHFFRFLLEQLQVQALDNLADAAQDPEHTVLIVFGAARSPNQVPSGLVEFIRSGGAVLIATKQPLDDDLEDQLGLSVRGKIVAVPGDSEAAYRKNQWLPMVKAVSGSKEPWHGLEHVACNCPSYLQVRNPRLRVIAEYPDNWIAIEPGASTRRFAGSLVFAVAGDWDKGRLLVMADESVFNNEMMMQEDNDNFALAYQSLQWVTDSGRRHRAYFVDNRRTVNDFQGVLAELSKPPPPPLEILNRMIAGMENDNFFNRFVLGPSHDIWPIWRGVTLGLALSVLGWGLFRLSRLRLPPVDENASTPLARAPSAALIDERHRTMVAAGNLYEGARDLCRQCFRSLGLTPGPSAEGGPRIPPPPGVVAHGTYRENRNLHRIVARAWALAYGDPGRISARQFAIVVRQLDELKTAVRDRRLLLNSFRGQA
jgi:hypothetical protein